MPSPIAAIDLIKTAMRIIGVLGTGETPSAQEANDGLQALNDVLETWSIEGLAVYGSNTAAFTTVAGQATYTMGATGNWVTSRPPDEIDSAYCTVSGVDFPVGIWTLAEYMNLPIKTQQQQIIERLLYINDFPNGQVILWPTPMLAIPVTLNFQRLLSQVTDLASTINLPPAYARGLQYAVAVEISPQYGSPIDVSPQARAMMGKIKSSNRQPRVMGFDSLLTGGGRVVPARGY